MNRVAVRVAAALLPIAFVSGCGHRGGTVAPAVAVPEQRPSGGAFEATAYSIESRTAAGTKARSGVVGADPAVLPLGSRIRVSDAGPYSGDYTVEDTGRAVKAREIDLYLPNDAEAQRFGRRRVQVEVLERGQGRRVAGP